MGTIRWVLDVDPWLDGRVRPEGADPHLRGRLVRGAARIRQPVPRRDAGVPRSSGAPAHDHRTGAPAKSTQRRAVRTSTAKWPSQDRKETRNAESQTAAPSEPRSQITNDYNDEASTTGPPRPTGNRAQADRSPDPTGAPEAPEPEEGHVLPVLATGVSKAGVGKSGYCKICAWDQVVTLNKRIRANPKFNSAQALEFASQYGFKFTRATFYTHKEHVPSKDRQIVPASRGPLQIRKSSNTEFLEAIRDIGFARAIADPEAISIEHALKATSILEGRKDKGSDELKVLVAVTIGSMPPLQVDGPVTEGEYTEVS